MNPTHTVVFLIVAFMGFLVGLVVGWEAREGEIKLREKEAREEERMREIEEETYTQCEKPIERC